MRAFCITVLLAVWLVCMPASGRRHGRKHGLYHHHARHQEAIVEERATKKGTVSALPGLNILLSSKENGVEFKIGECKVKVSMEGDCKYTLTPSPDTCGGTIPFASILNHFLPKNNLGEKSKTFVLPDKFDLKFLEIDKCKTTINFKAQAREKLDLIPGKLSIEGASLGLIINYKTGAVDWDLLELDITGAVTFADKKLPITVKKTTKQSAVTFAFKTDQVTIPSIVGKFSSKNEVAPPETDKEVVSKVTSVVIKSPTISGVYDPKGFYEMVVSGEPQGKIFQSSSFYIVIQKSEDSDVKAAVVAKLNLFSPATLLSELTGKDLTKIPLLKALVLNFAFAISNDDFAAIKDEKLAKEIGDFVKGEKTIQKGAKLYFDVPIKETFKKLAPDLKVDDFPPSLFMKVTIGKEGIKFKFPDEWKTDLLKILKGLAPKLKEYLPKWLQSDGPPLITINDFSFDYKTLAFTIDVMAKGPFNLGKILSLYNVSMKVSHKGEDSPYEFSFSSSQTLFGETLLTTKLTKSGADKYEFIGSISMIRTGQLIKALGVKFLSEETVAKLSFLDFGMSDVKLTARFGSQFYIGLSGKVILFGWDGVEFEGIIYQDAGMPVMALGLVINKIRLDEIVDKLFKKKLTGITWLTELNVVITMSTTDATPKTKDLKFTNPTLQAVGLKKGVMFRAVANIPADCKGDKICEMSKEVTKDEKTARALTIEGQITPSGVELKGTYAGNWELGKNVRIPNVKLVLKIGAETKVYFEVTVNIIEPPLELQGTVGIGGTGSLQLSAKMKGIWDQAFGIKFLSFGNLAFSIGIVPGVSVSEFAFEGELRLGTVAPVPEVKPKPALERRAADTGNQIVSKASLGINMVKPMDTYFYAEISKFTIGAVVKAFDLDVQLPKALMETGFPDGVIVSFAASPKGKELSTLKTKIESGFSFQGKINLLGYELYVNCRISYKPVKFALMVEMSPIKIAKGLIALQRSEKEADKGPMFQAVIAASGTQIKIKGYITVLGISAGVSIDVSDNGFEFSLSGNLFDVVRADVTIKGKYADIKTASFEVSACIKTGPADVQKEVKTTLDVAGKEATETMGEANKKAAQIGDLYLESKEGVTKMDGEIKEFQDKLRRKGDSISEAKKILNEKCIDECSTECIGGPDWDPKCLEIDGGFIGCPVWNDCKFKAPDYVCIAKCKGKKTLGILKAKAKQTALDALLFILKGIKKLFNIGKKFFQTSQKLLNTAKDVLKEAGEKLKAGLDAAKAAASTAVEKLVQIHSMCFQTGLDEAAKACVGLKINATFFQTQKVQFDTEGCLDVSFAKTIAQSISDKLYPGIKALKGKIGELKAKFGLIEKEKDNVEATAEEAKKACKGDDEEACAKATERSTLWTEEEQYYGRLAYEQLPRFTLLDGDTLSKFERDTPTMKATSDDAMARAVIPNEEFAVEVAKKRESVTDDSNDTPCARVAGTVRTLHELTRGLKGLADSHKKQHRSFHDIAKAKKNKINRLALGIRSECFYYSCTPENLHDALYYVRKAKKEINTWEKTVRSQIHKQGNQSFSFWKRQLDANTRNKRGFGIAQYLKDLNDAGKQFQTRTGIATDDPKNEALQQFAKDFTGLMTDDVPLSKAIPTIEKLATKIADVDALKENCGE